MSKENIEQYFLDPRPKNNYDNWLDILQLNINSYIKSRFAGRLTVNSGSDRQQFNINNVSSDDFIFTNIRNSGNNQVSIIESKCLNNKIEVLFSAVPASDCEFEYLIIKKG